MIIKILLFIFGLILGLFLMYLYCIYKQFKSITKYDSICDYCTDYNCHIEKGEN